MPANSNKFLGAGLLIGLIGILIYEAVLLKHAHQENTQLRLANAARVDLLIQENESLSKRALNPYELDQLRKDHLELMQLRAEKTLANERNRATTRPGGKKAPESAEALAQTEDSLWLNTWSSEVEENVPTGASLLVGGWQTKPGFRTYVLASPVKVDPTGIQTDDPSATQLTINAKLIEMDENIASNAGLPASETSATGQDAFRHLLLADEAATLITRLEHATNVSILSAPRMTTVSGRGCAISVTDNFTAPNGHVLSTGPELNLVPTINASGINLKLKTTINQKSELLAPNP